MKTASEHKVINDPFGTKQIFQLVIRKLASQALLFGLAVVIALVVAHRWLGAQSLPLLGAILFVYLFALAGYLFVEQKDKVTRRDPATMNRLVGNQMKSISNPVSDFQVEVWTAPVPCSSVT